MALKRVGVASYVSPNFTMDQRRRFRGRFSYIVTPTTEAAQTLLAAPTPPLHTTEARKLIHLYERRLAQLVPHKGKGRPALTTPPVVTGAALTDLREYLHPGEGIMRGQARIAAALGISPGHMRHLETGVRKIPLWIARQLRDYARGIVMQTHGAVLAETKALAPFAMLSEAIDSSSDADQAHQE